MVPDTAPAGRRERRGSCPLFPPARGELSRFLLNTFLQIHELRKSFPGNVFGQKTHATLEAGLYNPVFSCVLYVG